MTQAVYMPSDARIELDLFWGQAPDGRRFKAATVLLEADGGSSLRIKSAMADVAAPPGFAERLRVIKDTVYGYSVRGGVLQDELEKTLVGMLENVYTHLFQSHAGTVGEVLRSMDVEYSYYEHPSAVAQIRRWTHGHDVRHVIRK
jgi:hypothetical protein